MQANGLTTTFLNRCIRQITNVANQRIKEVPYVTALVHVLPTILNHPIFSRLKDGNEQYHLKFTGCLVHGRPIANFKTSLGDTGCEVGDLLLVCHDVDADAYRAMLLQAKVSDTCDQKKRIHKLGGNSSLNQLELYTKWPEFSLRGNGDKTYTINPNHIPDGANYMLLRHWRCPNVTVAKPSKNLAIGAPSFGACLLNFLKFRRGQSFECLPHRNNNQTWSGLISDLLSYVKAHGAIHCRDLWDDDIARVKTTDMGLIKATDMGGVSSVISDEVTKLKDIIGRDAHLKDGGLCALIVERSKDESILNYRGRMPSDVFGE